MIYYVNSYDLREQLNIVFDIPITYLSRGQITGEK